MPAKAVIRRRQAAVLAAAVAAFGLGATIGSGHEKPTSAPRAAAPTTTPEPDATPSATATVAPDAVEELSLQQQVGKLVVLRFDGTEVPAYVARRPAQGLGVGRDPFPRNIVDPQQLRAMTAVLRQGGQGRRRHADRLHRPGGRRDPQRRLGAARRARSPRRSPGRDAKAAAQALKRAGINVTLAPVADVPTRRTTPRWRHARSRRDPKRAAAATKAAVDRLDGRRRRPDREALPRARRRDRQHRPTARRPIGGGAPTAGDLAPFKAAIAAKVPLIMSSHAVYPRLDSRHIASQSPADPAGRSCASSCTSAAS